MKSQPPPVNGQIAVILLFLALGAAFLLNLWGRPSRLPQIPLVNPSFTSNATVRVSYAELIRQKADLSDFDCYACHERNKPPQLRFDDKHNLLVPKEHSDVVMGHGSHNRNNLCFNCHDETNLELFQTRDGRQLKLSESTPLCGSCHGPTYRDWEAGAHGRTSGYWNREMGSIMRVDCVSCHNPHAPRFPGRACPRPSSLALQPHFDRRKRDHPLSLCHVLATHPVQAAIASLGDFRAEVFCAAPRC